MNRIITILALVVFIAACAPTAPPAEIPVSQRLQDVIPVVPPTNTEEISTGQEHKVEVKDSRFLPNTLTIQRGDSVTWTNADGVPHTATGSDFDTGKLVKGQSSTVAFDKPGSYTYVCSIHPSMKATIVVE